MAADEAVPFYQFNYDGRFHPPELMKQLKGVYHGGYLWITYQLTMMDALCQAITGNPGEPAYDPSQIYRPGDIVWSNGILYFSNTTHQPGNQPPGDGWYPLQLPQGLIRIDLGNSTTLPDPTPYAINTGYYMVTNSPENPLSMTIWGCWFEADGVTKRWVKVYPQVSMYETYDESFDYTKTPAFKQGDLVNFLGSLFQAKIDIYGTHYPNDADWNTYWNNLGTSPTTATPGLAFVQMTFPIARGTYVWYNNAVYYALIGVPDASHYPGATNPDPYWQRITSEPKINYPITQGSVLVYSDGSDYYALQDCTTNDDVPDNGNFDATIWQEVQDWAAITHYPIDSGTSVLYNGSYYVSNQSVPDDTYLPTNTNYWSPIVNVINTFYPVTGGTVIWYDGGTYRAKYDVYSDRNWPYDQNYWVQLPNATASPYPFTQGQLIWYEDKIFRALQNVPDETHYPGATYPDMYWVKIYDGGVPDAVTVDYFQPHWPQGSVVSFNNKIYEAIVDVPLDIKPPNDVYWEAITEKYNEAGGIIELDLGSAPLPDASQFSDKLYYRILTTNMFLNNGLFVIRDVDGKPDWVRIIGNTIVNNPEPDQFTNPISAGKCINHRNELWQARINVPVGMSPEADVTGIYWRKIALATGVTGILMIDIGDLDFPDPNGLTDSAWYYIKSADKAVDGEIYQIYNGTWRKITPSLQKVVNVSVANGETSVFNVPDLYASPYITSTKRFARIEDVIAMGSGILRLGTIKYGAYTTADMNTIQTLTSDKNQNLTDGDECNNQQTNTNWMWDDIGYQLTSINMTYGGTGWSVGTVVNIPNTTATLLITGVDSSGTVQTIDIYFRGLSATDISGQVILAQGSGSDLEITLTCTYNGTQQWTELPVGTIAVNAQYDILFWYGTWVNNITYKGTVRAVVVCTQVSPAIWNLIVYADDTNFPVLPVDLTGMSFLTPTTVGPYEYAEWLQLFAEWWYLNTATYAGVRYYKNNPQRWPPNTFIQFGDGTWGMTWSGNINITNDGSWYNLFAWTPGGSPQKVEGFYSIGGKNYLMGDPTSYWDGSSINIRLYGGYVQVQTDRGASSGDTGNASCRLVIITAGGWR